MAKYEWSEVFMSIEGEARYSGHPTVYVRFARCNFQCRGFNNPTSKCPTCSGLGLTNVVDTGPYQISGDTCPECKGAKIINKPDVQPDGYASLGFDPKDYKSLQDIPLIHKGCDSQYAVNPKFSHMWGQGDEKVLAAEVLKVLPYNTFVNPVTKKRVILSLTGGEPTIRLKFWIPLLEELYQHGMRTILVETNAAAPMRMKDIHNLFDWAISKNTKEPHGHYDENDVKIVWSNSPKIRMSGEDWEDAIRPEIAAMQLGWEVSRNDPSGAKTKIGDSPQLEQYFKFVCGPNEDDFREVEAAMNAYHSTGVIGPNTDVYIMPVACTEEQQQSISARVAEMCIEKGYIYCHRIQNSVFGNGVGT
jgi:organic radical activating enzyme